jgi:putative ABC transport system permease protein
VNQSTLILRSLWHHARSHLGTFLGVAVGSAILTGALLVGDSVRGSLRDLALARLGKTEVALAGGDRFFRSAWRWICAEPGGGGGTADSTRRDGIDTG